MRGDNVVTAREGGASEYALGTIAAGEIVEIVYDGSYVRYLISGTVYRTVAATAGVKYAFAVGCISTGIVLNKCKFGPMSGNAWQSIGGSGKPADNATVGATFGVNIGGQINSGNISTYIAGAAIGDAYIANLSASKINAGSMDASYITAGTIHTDRLVVGAATASSSAAFSATALYSGAATAYPCSGSLVTLMTGFTTIGRSVFVGVNGQLNITTNDTGNVKFSIIISLQVLNSSSSVVWGNPLTMANLLYTCNGSTPLMYPFGGSFCVGTLAGADTYSTRISISITETNVYDSAYAHTTYVSIAADSYMEELRV